MPGSLTSYRFQLEVPILPRQKKKKFLVNLWFFDDKYVNRNNSTCIDLCLQNFSVITKLSIFVWMLFSLKVEKERLNERRKEREDWRRDIGAGGERTRRTGREGKGKGRGLEKERERNVVVLSLLSQAQVIFKVFPCWEVFLSWLNRNQQPNLTHFSVFSD